METGKRPLLALLLVGFLGLITFLTVLGFLVPWRPGVATDEGRGIDSVISYLLFVTGLILVAGHVVLVRFLWQSTGPTPAAYRRPSARTEWLWGIIPALVMLLISEVGVLAVASPVWDSLYLEEPADPILVEVTGKQFEWIVRYPGEDGLYGRTSFAAVDVAEQNDLGIDEKDPAGQDDVVKRGTLYLPRGRPVVVRLRTQDVIHSFFVPEFRVKQDLIPGFDTRLKFTPNRNGEFELACAELCGLGHYTMRGKVIVLEPAEFEAWLGKQYRFGG
ncbi:MAG: cytochrome-c oxidase [Planctomycetes bacterium]|nr:cytochrome-c oxidase [Planctomycetota bacterium]